jgi:hypothetical protein
MRISVFIGEEEYVLDYTVSSLENNMEDVVFFTRGDLEWKHLDSLSEDKYLPIFIIIEAAIIEHKALQLEFENDHRQSNT